MNCLAPKKWEIVASLSQQTLAAVMNRNLATEQKKQLDGRSVCRCKTNGLHHQRDTLRLLTVVYEYLLAASPGEGPGQRTEFNYHSQ
jgi:hypothetical protein